MPHPSDRKDSRSLFFPFASLLLVLCVFTPGCSLARIVVEPLPIEVSTAPPRSEPVPVYEVGLSMPSQAGIPFAALGAHGNGYADRTFLKKQLSIRGAKLGADFIIVVQSQINQGPTVTSFGHYTAVSSTIQTMSVYGHAYRKSPVRMGLNWDEKYVITDVVPGLPASRAGLHIGDRLLAVNGMRLSSDTMAVYRILAKSNPYDRLSIEVVAPDNRQRSMQLTLAAND